MEITSKIYVAGHRGMVGSAIVRALQREGFHDIVTRELAELDLTRQSDVEAFFEAERPAYVFLAAARVGGIRANDVYRAEFIYQNLQIQNNVIHTSWRSGVRKLLFLGSSCIYPKHAPQPMREEYLLTGPLEPTNEPYAIAKIAGLKMCESYNRQYGTHFISAMPTNLYGPNDNFDLAGSHVLPALIRKFHLGRLLSEGKDDLAAEDLGMAGAPLSAVRARLAEYGIRHDRVEVWGTGAPRREFLHVDDLAAALLFLMDRYDETEHINVGWGEDITIRELAETVRDVVGFEGDIVFNPAFPDGTPRKLLDISRLSALGWHPTIPLREGIRTTYRWYLESREKRR
ncbi:MAG: GDP-L-fucose synthase [Bacteroidota bacterium]|nr:GDP-L-fucose synthase [Bacteroidota bacterium]